MYRDVSSILYASSAYEGSRYYIEAYERHVPLSFPAQRPAPKTETVATSNGSDVAIRSVDRENRVADAPLVATCDGRPRPIAAWAHDRRETPDARASSPIRAADAGVALVTRRLRCEI